MSGTSELSRILSGIDGRGYKAYKDIQGSYEFDNFTLYIDYVQGDPFASPSKVRLRVPQTIAGVPQELYDNPVRQMALEDFLARGMDSAIRSTAQQMRGTGKSGMISVDSGGREVLKRTAVVVNQKFVEARIQAGLPARGRRVLGRQAEAMLIQEIPRIAEKGLLWRNIKQMEGRRFVECIENQEHIRNQLGEMGLVAFVADGSILPRKSGASDLPLSRDEAVHFDSSQCLGMTVEIPNEVPGKTENELAGMGIPRGVTLIVGGGYHGKSTVLKALERGVYPHIPDDGREYVVTCRDTVKIRAEDGRRIEKGDISPFISNLPYGRSTRAFSTDDASGSTSQAANIMEALEVGATALLLDEDTSATNFMIRDARMQSLVSRDQEPITPFIDRVRELYEELGVSTILVMGGSGDYFDCADTVIKMLEYVPHDVTHEAKTIAESHKTLRASETPSPIGHIAQRIPQARSFDASRGKRDVKIDAKSLDLIMYGREPIDLRHIDQLVDRSQTRAIGNAIHMAVTRFMDGKKTLSDIVENVEHFFDDNGLDALDPYRRGDRHPGNFARPRKYEIAAAINRLRTLAMEQESSPLDGY